MVARIAARLVLVVFLFVGARPAVADLLNFDKSSLTIATAQGPKLFHVELATTEPQREQGLMYRSTLAADAGMLFVYTYAQPVTFWMKNTIIPLDMIFIGSDGHVVSIHEREVPFSEEAIPSGEDAQYVLEVNGGTVDRLGIATGDVVTGPALAPQ